MNIRKITEKTDAFVFDNIEEYLTGVFLIEKKSRIYLIDTYCGPDGMQPVIECLRSKSEEKELIVINTHFHWDHVWGNCSFEDKCIVSHELCRELLEKHWDMQIKDNGKYFLGKVEKCLPNFTFSDKVTYCDDGIELFHSPGHTEDSISVFDHDEKILYVGDNLEKPIVYVENSDIPRYINTLKSYIGYRPEKIVASHTIELTVEDLMNTVKYLEGLLTGKTMSFGSAYENRIHQQNLQIAAGR